MYWSSTSGREKGGGVFIDDLLKRLQDKRGNREREEQRVVYERDGRQMASEGESGRGLTERGVVEKAQGI